jgi:hypothetical protein
MDSMKTWDVKIVRDIGEFPYRVYITGYGFKHSKDVDAWCDEHFGVDGWATPLQTQFRFASEKDELWFIMRWT